MKKKVGQLDWSCFAQKLPSKHAITDITKTRSDGDEEEDVKSYWMNLRKTEDTENWKRKYQIAFGGELALEVAMGLS